MKKMIIATFVLASIANAKLPVNISVGLSSAYDKLYLKPNLKNSAWMK